MKAARFAREVSSDRQSCQRSVVRSVVSCQIRSKSAPRLYSGLEAQILLRLRDSHRLPRFLDDVATCHSNLQGYRRIVKQNVPTFLLSSAPTFLPATILRFYDSTILQPTIPQLLTPAPPSRRYQSQRASAAAAGSTKASSREAYERTTCAPSPFRVGR